MDVIKQMLKSKKFLAAVSSVLFVLVGTHIGITEQQTMYIVGLAVSYILGQGIADVNKNGNGSGVARR